MSTRTWSPAALAWLREYAGSIDSTALLLAFEAGERRQGLRLRKGIEEAAGREFLAWERVCAGIGPEAAQERERHDYAHRLLRSLLSAPAEVAGREEDR